MVENKNCTACNIKLDKDKFKKIQLYCKNCYKIKKENKISEKSSVNDEQLNNRTILVGSSLSGKTYLMLKFLS